MYSTPSAFRHPTSFRLTGSPYSGTGPDPDSAFFFIPGIGLWWKDTLNVHTAGGGKTPCTSIYCLWWKDTLHVHTAGSGKTPCTSTLLVTKRHPERPYCCWWKETCTSAPCWWWKNTLHSHTAGVLVMERHHITWLAGPAGAGRARVALPWGWRSCWCWAWGGRWRCCPPCCPSGAGSGRGCAAGLCRDHRRGAREAADLDAVRSPLLLGQILWPAPCPQRCCAGHRMRTQPLEATNWAEYNSRIFYVLTFPELIQYCVCQIPLTTITQISCVNAVLRVSILFFNLTNWRIFLIWIINPFIVCSLFVHCLYLGIGLATPMVRHTKPELQRCWCPLAGLTGGPGEPRAARWPRWRWHCRRGWRPSGDVAASPPSRWPGGGRQLLAGAWSVTKDFFLLPPVSTQQYQWYTLSREFWENLKGRALMGYSRAWGKLIHEKNLMSKKSCDTVPF
jgi:hypothetical protein